MKETRKYRPTQSRIKQNNDHTRILRKIRFRSSCKTGLVETVVFFHQIDLKKLFNHQLIKNAFIDDIFS